MTRLTQNLWASSIMWIFQKKCCQIFIRFIKVTKIFWCILIFHWFMMPQSLLLSILLNNFSGHLQIHLCLHLFLVLYGLKYYISLDRKFESLSKFNFLTTLVWQIQNGGLFEKVVTFSRYKKVNYYFFFSLSWINYQCWLWFILFWVKIG